MKRKIFAILICALLITTIASFSATAIKCEKKPTKDLIKLNSRPDAPKVKIPEEVKQGEWLYIKTITSDPDNDNVYYRFDINGHDYGWVGPFQSDEEHLEKVIIFVPLGQYTLGVQAKDIHNAMSDWTYTHFTVVKTKSISLPFFNFLQSNEYLFPLLRHLFGL